ncbi:hypothetical protein MYCTH_2297930 [Thermothelomyces thermophilus ATCC 42464]|uniref:Proteophosphoglycan ppg4 n=1 Tax=Thermothelomyces thermophilus (strain ATCC 42464 / BCRC 31852 / DSM 1799) TaxID=573729 RepID=G2Q019_THET4|nr:uncharacterized protein MYCTH_2297930 [Thermothelomyces thermophilus ATCC 42464]AEO54843.1 hypothetical protein MYCTH_2297930 [Thermothelomyces thermophilus ATCC 42464]
MGNAQSTDGPRRTTQRLSKPRTGNHATPGLLSPGVFSSSRSRHLSNAQLPGPQEPSPTVSSTPTTSSAPEVAAGGPGSHVDNIAPFFPPAPASQEELKRRSLFRSRSTRGDNTARQNHNGGPGSQPVNRTSRASSVTYESAVACYGQAEFETRPAQSDRRTSVNYNLTSYEAKRLLNLAEEPHLERAAAMSDNMIAVTEPTWNPCNQGNNPSSPITRTSSDVSLYMPVRRRSLIQTPGVATRSSLAHDIPPVSRVSVRHSLPVTPRLSRQQSVESYRNGTMPTEPWMAESESSPRVATPCEDDYLSIGAFKLGSLRITNGFPSPVTPDVDENRDENDGSESRPAAVQEGYFTKPQNSESDITPGAATRNDMASPKVVSEISHSPSSAPTTQERLASQGLQTTSKTTALDDQLFNDDAQPEYSSVEVLDVRPDPNAKPPHAQLARSIDSSVKRADSGFVSMGRPSSEGCCKPLAKADSGYSSNVSLRSFQAKAQGVENQSNASPLEKQFSRPSNKRAEDQVGSETQESPGRLDVLRPTSLEIEAPPPPVPPKNIARPSFDSRPRLDSTTKSVRAHDLSGGERSKTPNAVKYVPKPTVTVLPDSEWPMPLGPEAWGPESVSSSASGKLSSPRSTTGGVQKPGRLQRFLGGARRATISTPAVGTLHAFEHDCIPPVPREAEQKLRGRPSRVHSTPKRPAPRSRPSLDTLKTIFSVGSIEASLDAVNTMHAKPAASGSENKEGAWKQGLQSVPASLANIAGHVIPRRTRVGKSVLVRQGETAQDSQGSKIGSKNVTRGDLPRVGISAPVSPPKSESGKRTMSLTFEGERAMAPSRRTFDANSTRPPPPGLPSPALPSPIAKAMSAESNNRAPETAHSIRRPQILRVPPSLSRKASRESLQSNSASHPSLARQTSMSSIRSYHSSQVSVGYSSTYLRTQSLVSMDPRRFRSFRQYSLETSPYNSPTREVHGNFARGTSQALAGNEGRRNSISSVRSEGVYRPADVHGWHIRVPQPPLRHRTSFEGYHGYQQWYPQHGYPPSMSNGYTAPAKTGYDPRSRGQVIAAATWSRSQFDAAAGQWYQGQSPQFYPLGHSRSRSMGSQAGQGPNPPYRVLHSYNSPAYRNAPIWG